MATTLREFASNIQSQLKQSGDDKDIKFPQIVLWTSYFINKKRYTKGGGMDSGAYLSIFTDVPVLKASANADNSVIKGRKYIELPTSIYDYDKDRGIKYLSYIDFEGTCSPAFTQVDFTRTTPRASKRLYYNVYEYPNPQNPYFYRVGDKLYLLGIEEIQVPYLEIGLISTFDPFAVGSLDSELDVGEEALAEITKQVLDLGRFMMLMPQDNTNDSIDSVANEEVPKSKIISVNEAVNINTQQQE